MKNTTTTTTDQTTISSKRGAWLIGTVFGVYSIIALTLAGTGFFASIDTNFFPAVVALATVALTAGYFLSPSVRALAVKLGPYGLAYFHVWRIPAGLAFIYYGSQNWLPDVFVSLAGWGDILAGSLAALIILLPRSIKLITGFHIVGFADFLVAVGTGITLNAIAAESMANIVLLPIAIIPLVGVPLSGATHIAAMHMLLTSQTENDRIELSHPVASEA